MTYLQTSNHTTRQPAAGTAPLVQPSAPTAQTASQNSEIALAADQARIRAASPSGSVPSADYAALGAQAIESALGRIRQGKAVEKLDLTQNNSPANLPMARALIALGHGSPAEKAQLQLFESGLQKLATGEKPGAEEIDALRRFGIGYAQNPMQEEENQIMGLVLYRNHRADYAERGLSLGTGSASLPREDLRELLNMLAQVKATQAAAPGAFAATAEALSKDEAVLAMDQKIGEVLKSAQALGLQAEAKRNEVTLLTQSLSDTEQKLASQQQQTQTLKQDIIAAVAEAPPATQPAQTQPESKARPESQPELVDQVIAAGAARPDLAPLIDSYLDSVKQEQALDGELTDQRARLANAQQQMNTLYAQAQTELKRAEELMAKSKQLQQEAAAAHARAQREIAAAGPVAAWMQAPLSAMQAEVAARVSARESEYQSLANWLPLLGARIAEANAAAGGRAAGLKAGILRAQRPALHVTPIILPLRPMVPVALGVAGPSEPAVDSIHSQDPIRLATQTQQAARAISARYLETWLNRERQEREHQTARREALSWQSERQHRQSRFSA